MPDADVDAEYEDDGLNDTETNPDFEPDDDPLGGRRLRESTGEIDDDSDKSEVLLVEAEKEEDPDTRGERVRIVADGEPLIDAVTLPRGDSEPETVGEAAHVAPDDNDALGERESLLGNDENEIDVLEVGHCDTDAVIDTVIVTIEAVADLDASDAVLILETVSVRVESTVGERPEELDSDEVTL